MGFYRPNDLEQDIEQEPCSACWGDGWQGLPEDGALACSVCHGSGLFPPLAPVKLADLPTRMRRMTTTTPAHVLEAGRRERERWSLRKEEHTQWGVNVRGVPNYTRLYVACGTRRECQDFIEDRVFRAMLRAYCEENGSETEGSDGMRRWFLEIDEQRDIAMREAEEQGE